MKKIRYFKCKNGHEVDKFVDDHIKQLPCEECELVSVRMLSAPKCFQNTTGKSPSAK